jgi:hypothetical protein
MKAYYFFACINMVLLLSGCASSPRQHKTRLQLWIDNCDQRKPPWTLQEKAQLNKELAKKRELIERVIRENKELQGARVKARIYTQAVNAGCIDAVLVEISGNVKSAKQKRILQTICRKYSSPNSDGIQIYGGNDVGMK